MVILVPALPALAIAQIFPAFTQTGTYSNVGWSVNTTRGWSFMVSSPIVVDQLGFWDSGQDGLADAHAVGLTYPSLVAPVELTASFKAHPAPNQPPVADAGPDRSAYTGVAIVLRGSATDP